MNILLYSNYLYPAKASAGAERVVERLCRGFKKLGHKVYLHAYKGSKTDTGAILVDSIPADTDVIHVHSFCLEDVEKNTALGKPWVGTIHGGGMETDPVFLNGVKNHPNVICVSKFVADRLQCQAFVHTCASPEEFMYQEKKQNYFLYLAGFGWGVQKGLDIFIQLARKFRQYDFYIAGAGNESFAEELKKAITFDRNIKYLGEVNGQTKANYLANAKALVYPTHLADACPSSVIEAIISGTPVIGSANGSMPEIVPPVAGIICRNIADYMKAIMNIDSKKPEEIRKYAMDNYSDVVACKKHLVYYENVIKTGRVI